MSKPLFFVADEQQKVADVFGAEKTAGEAQLSEDHNQWASEILNELYRQVPYVADFEIDVVLDKVDAERGFGFGHIEVGSKTEALPTATPEQLENAGVRTVRIPVIVKGNILQPFDVLVTEDSKMLPLTEQRLRQAIFRPQMFDVTSKTPGDQTMVGQLYPPFRQNYGFGSGGGFGGFYGAQKLSSVLAAVLQHSNESDLDSFKSSLLDNFTKSAYAANVAAHTALEKIANARPSNVKVAAASFGKIIKPSVLQLVKAAAGYKLKTASHRCWAPHEELIDRGEAVRRCGEKIVLAADMSGAVTLPDEDAAPSLPEVPKAQLVTEPGLYEVQSLDGETLVGLVVPNLLDIDGKHKPIAFFSDGQHSAVQADIAGVPKGAAPELEGEPAVEARGSGVFFYTQPDGELCMTIPLTLKNAVTMPDGCTCYIAETFDGRPVSVKVQPYIQTVVPAVDESTLLVPSSWSWLPLDSSASVALSGDEAGVGKVASAKRVLGSVTVRGGGVDCFSLDGMPLSKVARDEREFVSQDQALFLLAGLGANLKEAQLKLAEASTGRAPVQVPVSRSIKTAEQVRGEAYTAAARQLSGMPVFRQRLWKEAAVVPDPVAVDAVLSLGFVNPENVAAFIGYLPILEEAQRRLCELLVASRLGLKHVPTSALEKCVRALEEVLEGVKEMAFQE